jgi:hypothetical protein
MFTPQHHPEQFLIQRGDAGIGRPGRGLARPEYGGAPLQHVAGHLADQVRLDLQDEGQERPADGGLEDLSLEVQVTRQHQVAEGVVHIGFAADRHGFAALGHDAQGQRLNLPPGASAIHQHRRPGMTAPGCRPCR